MTAKEKLPPLTRSPLILISVLAFGTAYTWFLIGDQGSKLTLAVKQGVEGVALKQIAQNYSRFKHVSVEVVELPYDDLYEAEEAQLREKSYGKFDVFMVDDPWLYSLVDRVCTRDHRLLNLNSILQGHESDFFE